MDTRWHRGLALVLLLTVGCSAFAAPVGPVYPPPGGVDWSGSGSGLLGTATWEYSNHDATGLSGLYFGLNQVDYGELGAGLNGTADPFTFFGVSGTTAEWRASTIWENAVTLIPQSALTRLTMTVTGLGSNPWTTDLTSIGLDNTATFGDLGAVVDNSSGSDFTLQWSIEADVGSGWQSINSIQQHFTNDGNTRSSFATGYFYEAAPVPVPAAVWFFASALGVFGLMGKRKQHA